MRNTDRYSKVICQFGSILSYGVLSLSVEGGFYERCLSLCLCIFYQTSLRSGGCPCLCQTSMSEQSVLTGSERCLLLIVRCLFPFEKKRKLDGIFALCHTCLTNRQSHCKQKKKKKYRSILYHPLLNFPNYETGSWFALCDSL